MKKVIKKINIVVWLLFCFISVNSLIAQMNGKEKSDSYIGIYYEYNASSSSLLHLYENDFYVLYYNIELCGEVLIKNCDTGYYAIQDKILNLYLGDTLVYQFDIIDTLNIQIRYSEKNNLKLNQFFRRDYAFFREQRYKDEGIYADGCLSCRWAMGYDYEKKSYKCYYYNSPNADDRKSIKKVMLSDSIYKRLNE